MSFKPLIIDAGQFKQLPSGQALDVGGWTLPTAGGTDTYQLTANGSGNGVWTAPSFGSSIPANSAANEIYVGTGAGTAAWTTDLAGLTSLTVDNITINGAVISSDTGAISFSNENLTTTGSMTANTLTDGTASLTGGSLTGVKLGSLTTNGFVKTSGSDGTLSIDTSTYLTAEVDTLDTVADRGATTNQILTTGGLTTTGTVDAGLLTVDNITINGATITSDTGAISFSNENLSTSGKMSVGSEDTVYTYSMFEVAGPYAAYKYCSQVHIRSDAETYGLFMGSGNESWAIISCGSHFFSSTDYRATATTANAIAMDSNGFHFLVNTGLTPGGNFTATERLKINTSGIDVTGTILGDFLTIDNISINGASITSNTGAISFSNENLTSTGTVVGSNIPSPTIDDQVLISTASGVASWSTAGNNQVLASDGSGEVAWANQSFGFDIPGPASSGQVYVATGAGAASWTTDLTGLTNLTVDNININGAVITSDTGAISFSNENLTTTGKTTSGSLTLTTGGLKRTGTDTASYSNLFSERFPGNPKTGICVIDLPTGFTGTQGTITIRGYNYSSSTGPWEVLFGGYAYNSTPDIWYNYRASVIGQVPFDLIRAGYNGNTGKACIMLGETDTNWFYPAVQVESSLHAYVYNGFESGWDVGFYTDQTNFYNNEPDQADPVTVPWNRDFNAPSADNQLLASTGDKVAAWTDTLDILKVDNITINGAAITSDTGAISFSNENLTTSGWISASNTPSPSATGKALVSTGANTAAWYVTGLYDVLKIEVPSASGAERKFVLTADPSSQFEIEAAPWPLTLTANETVYVRTTGNDTTGDGSATFPFLTLNRTIEHIGGFYIGDYTVTIDIGEGTFTESGTLTFMHPFGAQVTFQGVSERIDDVDTTGISGTTSYGHDNLYYRNVTMVLPVGKSVAVGNYIGIATATGGTNPNALVGVHKVSAWVSGTRTATLQVSYRNGSETPSGTITCDIDLIKSVIAFSNRNGMKISGPYFGGNWRGLVIQGDYDANNAQYGIWALNGAVVAVSNGDTSGFACGVWGFKTNFYAQNNGLIFADYAYATKCGQHVCSCQNGGILGLRYARISACNNYGIYAFNGSTIAASNCTVVGTGNNSVTSYQGSFIDLRNSFVGESNSTTSIYADRWAAIDGTGATVDDAISPATDGNNDGSYVIGL